MKHHQKKTPQPGEVWLVHYGRAAGSPYRVTKVLPDGHVQGCLADEHGRFDSMTWEMAPSRFVKLLPDYQEPPPPPPSLLQRFIDWYYRTFPRKPHHPDDGL